MSKNFNTAKLLPLGVLSFFISGLSWAGQPATDSELSSKLEEMQRKHDWQTQTRTGPPKLPLLMHQGLARRILCFLAY